jgi:hypothetical protein
MTKTANWKDLLHKTIFLVGEIIHGVKAFARTELYLNTQAIHNVPKKPAILILFT